MTLSKSKLALAKVINENGGWKDANFAAQEKCGMVYFYFNEPNRGGLYWHGSASPATAIEAAANSNWHRCFISREEYHQAYPKADDIKLEIRWVRGGEVCATPTSHDCMVMLKERGYSLQCDCKECNDFYRREETSHEDADVDGWIEWNGGECPVSESELVDYKLLSGSVVTIGEIAGYLKWSHEFSTANIIAYRLHKPEIKPEFCESVTRSIPEPVVKPTIEQLAQDYRNKLDHANLKQQDADDAKDAADAALGELERAGEAIGLVISAAKQSAGMEIDNWRDLKIGDYVEYVSGGLSHLFGRIGIVTGFDQFDSEQNVKLSFDSFATGDTGWPIKWRFIRRP